MRKSFIHILKKNLAFAKLAMISNLEYRFNFVIDTFFQPIVGVLVELTLWVAIFSSLGSRSLAGFELESYLSYVVWAAFVSRITINWAYEFRMIDDIEKGTLNTILLRPMSFFEFYLSQFIGYKAISAFFSFVVPLSVVWAFRWPMHWERLPITMILIFYYLIFVHLLSFILATFSFQFTKVNSFSVAKNLLIWVLSGEILPMDLLPKSSLYPLLIHLPFANGVYIPVAFITGRISWDVLAKGFLTTTIGIVVLAPIARYAWQRGLKIYTGTGA